MNTQGIRMCCIVIGVIAGAAVAKLYSVHIELS